MEMRHSPAVDAIRFLAAFCVVLHHAIGVPGNLGRHLFGSGFEWVSPVVAGFKEGACGEWCTYNPDRAKERTAPRTRGHRKGITHDCAPDAQGDRRLAGREHVTHF